MYVALYAPNGRAAALDARIARTPAARAMGFTGRTSLAPDEAILFAFPEDTRTPFTLAATGVALDLAFFDAAGRMVGAHYGARARDPRPYGAPGPYRYALEVPAGWLAAHGVGGPGTVIAWSSGGFTQPV